MCLSLVAVALVEVGQQQQRTMVKVAAVPVDF